VRRREMRIVDRDGMLRLVGGSARLQ
jgi:hypothetical protein